MFLYVLSTPVFLGEILGLGPAEFFWFFVLTIAGIMPWADYIEAMREGVRRHGPVRAGVYAMTTSADEKVAGV